MAEANAEQVLSEVERILGGLGARLAKTEGAEEAIANCEAGFRTLVEPYLLDIERYAEDLGASEKRGWLIAILEDEVEAVERVMTKMLPLLEEKADIEQRSHWEAVKDGFFGRQRGVSAQVWTRVTTELDGSLLYFFQRLGHVLLEKLGIDPTQIDWPPR